MFKKFKDKLAEEMKQSPSRLQAGMQQLAQAVISPAASNNLIQDITTSVEDLQSTSEDADVLRNNSATSQFQSVDLLASNSMERSRRSSFSSVTSENFFPSYESPGNLYHLQSDMEQSASEFEDSSSSSQLEHISKDELYAGYQKLRTKYTKYRAVYRELYKENMKMKSVLVETQDKALRRIANLKEQCQLEQEAKAHLEEALRNDIEEKDHLINTLTTKIKLLQDSESSTENSSTLKSVEQPEKSNFDLLTEPTSANEYLIADNSALKEKVKKFEVLLAKCNESLKKNKEKISQLTENRDILERDLNILRNSSSERTEMLESEVYKAKREILSLNEQVDVLKKREEDSALSLAENKLFIHRELEVKEEQNKQLQQELKKITEYKDILAEAVVKYDREFKQFEVLLNNGGTESSEKLLQLQNLFTNKSEAVKLIQQDVKLKFLGTQEEIKTTNDKEIKQNNEKSTPLQEAENEGVVKNEEISRSRDELEIKNAQLLGLATELKSCKSTINDLKEMLKEVTMDWEQTKRQKEYLIANILKYEKILGKLRQDCNSVKAEIKENHSEQEVIIESMNKKFSAVFDSIGKNAEKEATVLSVESEKESQDLKENVSSLNNETSSIELKTIINENNALRQKCEHLAEENELMVSKVNEFDKINLTNIKLIAEIDELNFKLRDITELHETQDKLQSEMEELKQKSPFSNDIPAGDDHFTNQVSVLKSKLDHYDALNQDNTLLKQQLVELKNELATALSNTEVLKLEQSKNIELGIANFSQKCAEYENMIVSLTNKFSEQTLQLEKLHHELAKQKTNFRDLNDRYENRNSEFKETNNAFMEQASELRELDKKYKTQCSEIESLREKETEILKQLDETVKVREEMIIKFNELETCKNNIIEKKSMDLEELKSRHEEMLKDLASYKEMKIESVILESKELELLTENKTQLTEEIERLKSENNEIEILRNANTILQLELEKLREDNVEVLINYKELKEEQISVSKFNAELKLSQENLQQENNELKSRLPNLENELQQLRERLDAERINLEQRISELNQELENATAEVQARGDESIALREKMSDLEALGSKEAATKSEIERKNGLLLAQVSELQTKSKEFENLHKANIELEEELKKLRVDVRIVTELEAENAKLLTKIEELNGELENKKLNMAELETQKSENMNLHSELQILTESEAKTLKEVEYLQQWNKNLALEVEDLRTLVDQKEAELNSLTDANKKLLRELEVINSNQSKTLEDKSKTITELEKTTVDLKNEIIEQRREVDALKITNKELQDQLVTIHTEHLNTLTNKTQKITELEKAATNFENKLVEHMEEADALKHANKELEDQLIKININHSNVLEDKTRCIAELEKRTKDFENKFIEQRQEIDAEKILSNELRVQLAEIDSNHSIALDDKVRTITELEKAVKDFENKLIGRREEVHHLEATNKDLREQLMSITQNKVADEAFVQNYDGLQKENQELRTRLDEAVILYETKESQIEILNQELKHQTQVLTDKLRTNEQEHSMRIKQLVKEFQAQIHDKDEQIQAALEKRFERQQNYESELIQQYKEQLKDFQVELTAKSEQIESLILDNKETIQAYKDQIEELTQAIAEVKKEHTSELQNIEQNWKTVLKQRTGHLETKHVDEVNELTKEWLNERKTAENSDTSPGELESTSRVAMATIQSNTGSLHSLQQTLISQKRELSELRKLLRIRNESLEGSTEIEYLRNILFEYMMGRETLVLTRVISAVVKFDKEQTSKVLKKEEDKLTLLGSLGLL